MCNSDWTCIRCGRLNFGGFRCAKCRNDRPLSKAHWICTHCKRTNVGRAVCSECGNQKDSPALWTCGVCGWNNSSDVCAKCNSHK